MDIPLWTVDILEICARQKWEFRGKKRVSLKLNKAHIKHNYNLNNVYMTIFKILHYRD